MLRIGTGAGAGAGVEAEAGFGVSISNILRTGTMRGELETPPFVTTLDERLGFGSKPISNMLRTGDRGFVGFAGFVKGDGARPESLDPDDPRARPAGGPSNKARTSFRSSSNIDSNDMCLAMVATA
jgi:hypothetical protein